MILLATTDGQVKNKKDVGAGPYGRFQELGYMYVISLLEVITKLFFIPPKNNKKTQKPTTQKMAEYIFKENNIQPPGGATVS